MKENQTITISYTHHEHGDVSFDIDNVTLFNVNNEVIKGSNDHFITQTRTGKVKIRINGTWGNKQINENSISKK